MKFAIYPLLFTLFLTPIIPLKASDSLPVLQEEVKKQTTAARDFYLEKFLWDDLTWDEKEFYLPEGRLSGQTLHKKITAVENDINLLLSHHSNPLQALNRKNTFGLNPLQYAMFVNAPQAVRTKLRKAGSLQGDFTQEGKIRDILYKTICSNDTEKIERVLALLTTRFPNRKKIINAPSEEYTHLSPLGYALLTAAQPEIIELLIKEGKACVTFVRQTDRSTLLDLLTQETPTHFHFSNSSKPLNERADADEYIITVARLLFKYGIKCSPEKAAALLESAPFESEDFAAFLSGKASPLLPQGPSDDTLSPLLPPACPEICTCIQKNRDLQKHLQDYRLLSEDGSLSRHQSRRNDPDFNWTLDKAIVEYVRRRNWSTQFSILEEHFKHRQRSLNQPVPTRTGDTRTRLQILGNIGAWNHMSRSFCAHVRTLLKEYGGC